MQNLRLILIPITIFILACNDNKTISSERKNIDSLSLANIDTPITNRFAYKLEQKHLDRIKDISKKLGLYDLQKGTETFELRMWLIPSMWDPSILYVLKRNDSTWTLFHYQYYCIQPEYKNYYTPNIDSVNMESVRPQKINWASYIRQLQLDNLWLLKTESSIKDKSFGVLDGNIYLTELSDKGKYKYLYYTIPETYQEKDTNHRRFIEFKKRLIDPIIYNGIRNP
jgi:hypothetical protein